MILLDVAKELKNRGYGEIPTPDLVGVLRDGFKAIAEMAAATGEEFSLQVPRFGTFRVLKRKARVGFNPQTKEKINIEEKLIFKLRVSSKLKGEMSGLVGKKTIQKKVKKEKKKK